MPVLKWANGASLRLTMLGFEGIELAVGTGFIVRADNGTLGLATARHCFSGRDAEGGPISETAATPSHVAVRHNPVRVGDPWVTLTYPLIDDAGRALWLEHPTFGAAADVAVLAFRQPEVPVGVYAYDLGPGGLVGKEEGAVEISPGSDLFVVGFPFGRVGAGDFPIWTRATIATEPRVAYNGKPVFLVDARTRKGQSGSPVIYDAAGRMTKFESGNSTLMLGGTELTGLYVGQMAEGSDLGMVYTRQAVGEVAFGHTRSVLQQT